MWCMNKASQGQIEFCYIEMNKEIRLVVASLLLGLLRVLTQKPFNASGFGNPIIPRIFYRSTVKKVWRYVLYVCHYGWQLGPVSVPAQVWTSKDFSELDVDAHELAGQSLDMGSRCDETYGWELLFLLSALYDFIAGSVKRRAVLGKIYWVKVRLFLYPTVL